MGVMYYILSPFSWLLNFFYSFTDSYGISLILFALVIKIILFPLKDDPYPPKPVVKPAAPAAKPAAPAAAPAAAPEAKAEAKPEVKAE